jgi:hypothetical protein
VPSGAGDARVWPPDVTAMSALSGSVSGNLPSTLVSLTVLAPCCVEIWSPRSASAPQFSCLKTRSVSSSGGTS